jgi:hypothetical protein
MKRLWDWFGRNAANLRGVAALVVIISALGGVLLYVRKLLQPELTVMVRENSAAMPPDVVSWVREANDAMRYLPLLTSTNEPKFYSRLRGLVRTNVEDDLALNGMDFGQTRIDLVNETDHVVTGVRMRFDYPPFWNAFLQAGFLTDQECASWQKGLPPRGSHDIVLPEFPSIPPRSSLVLFIYCRGGVAQRMAVTVPGSRYKIVNTVQVEDRWPVSWALRPFAVAYFGALLLLIGVPVVVVWYHAKVWRRAERLIPYNLACNEAKAGRKEKAIALLSMAITAGYRDFKHMRDDPDLKALHGNPKFEALVTGEAQQERKMTETAPKAE